MCGIITPYPKEKDFRKNYCHQVDRGLVMKWLIKTGTSKKKDPPGSSGRSCLAMLMIYCLNSLPYSELVDEVNL